jgi:signal transduction histidine kinase
MTVRGEVAPASTDGKMESMRAWRILASSVELAERSALEPAELAQPIAVIAAIVVLVCALAMGSWPASPLWAITCLLAFGLISGLLARLADARPVHQYVEAAAAFAALLIIPAALPDAHPSWPVSPLWVVALLLGLGLAAPPLTRHVDDLPGSALAFAALAATLILLWNLSNAHWFIYYTTRALRPDNGTEVAALRPLVDLLSFALVVSALPGHRTVRRVISFVALAVALSMIVSALVSPPSYGLWPVWTYDWAMVALGSGLAAVIITRLVTRPNARALLERVDELSRTRSGVLDVQAAELRRIERDLHDGAQVQLVALSMKLGRAEDRYREDPVTAALLREAREDAISAIRELRALARGIAPVVLANRGLESAVRSLAQRSDSEVIVTSRINRRPPPAVERAAYFVVSESLANAAKHAPGARVEINLHLSGGDLLVVVSDSGPGGANLAGGGLTGLCQRVEALDGRLRVTSPAGVGTQVEVVMPCGW